MTRILLVADRFLRRERTGIDTYYDKLMYWLPRLAPDWEFTLVSFGEPDQHLPSFAPNLKHRGLPMSRRRFYLASLLGLGDPFGNMLEEVDLIHAMLPLCVRTSKPFLVTVHDLSPLLVPKAYDWHGRLMTHRTLRCLAKRGAWFNVVSDSTGTDLHNLFGVPPQRIHRIYEGVDREFYAADQMPLGYKIRAKYHLPERYFLFIGSMHKRKNLSTLLKAYRIFKSEDPTDTKLVLAGRMSLGGNRIAKQIQALELEQDVLLPGYIDEVDLPVVVGEAVALVYPSLYEGFGLPTLEAMACGTPVIASRTGSIPEVTGGHAMLCDPMDVSCFCKAMSRMSTDTELRARLVRRGSKWVEQFSWTSTAEAVLELYEQVLEAFRP